MPEGTSPAEGGRPEAGRPQVGEIAFHDDVVVHHEPVRVPVSALPAQPKPPGAAFSTTFVIGTSAALWFAAALVSGERMAVTFAVVWLVVLLIDFRHNLKR